MNSKSGFKLNKSGVRQLLKSEEMKKGLEQYAEVVKIMTGSPEDYKTETYNGKNRANISVTTANRKAMQDCLDNNTLLKAIGSARR